MGRYSRVAHALGASVVALDLSPAVARLADLAENSDRMHLVQGNLMAPPFRKETFDIVYSVGVIQHTKRVPIIHFRGVLQILKDCTDLIAT